MQNAAEALAVPVGHYKVVVVHMDTSSENFGRFETEDEATDWAMKNRGTLGLHRSASWYVAERA